MASADIIQRGSKLFWKARTTIDVLLVEHKHCDVIEIVCSDSTTSQEAPRLFLNASVLRSKICDDEIQSRLFDLTEPILQRKGTISPIDKEILLRQVWKNAMYEYVDERLELHKKLAGSKAFHVMLRKPLFSEGPDSNDGVPLMCDAPPSLVRHELDHFTAPRESVIEESKEIITAESAATTHSAHALTLPETNLTISTGAAATFLTVRERWRIPIVFAKVARGRRLNRGDTQIWQAVASNLLSDSDLHERLAIANLESSTMCADFVARQYIHMPAMSPVSSSRFVRPPPIDTSPLAHGRHFHTHQHGSNGSSTHHSPKISPKVSPKPSTDRFSKPEPSHSGSFKFGIDALTSSLSRGLQSLGSSLDTKNKQYRAAAAADLGSDSATARLPLNPHLHNTPTGPGKPYKELDFHARSESTAGMDTPTSHASLTSRGHRLGQGGSPRRHSRGTPRGGGKLTTPRHLHQQQQVPASPMSSASRDHSLTVGVVGVFDESDLTSPRRLREAQAKGHGHGQHPEKQQREWFAVSLSRKLAGLVSGAPASLASFTGSGKHRARVAVSSDEEDEDEQGDQGSVGADIAAEEDCSFDQASPDGAVQYGEDGLGFDAEAENLPFAAQSQAQSAGSGGSGSGSGGDTSKSQVHVLLDGVNTPPQTRQNTTSNTASSTPLKPSGGVGVGGAISNILNNLSGKHGRAKNIKVKKTSPSHSTHHTAHPVGGNNPSASASTSGTPAVVEGPVQKFFQLITLRGRNVVIRPTVTIKHDTVVQFY